jgi:hypothetical protein
MPDSEQPLYLNSAGQIVPVAPESAADVEQTGWLPASPKQVEDYRLQQEHGGIASQAATVAESAGSALTFGLSAAAEKALGVTGIAERREANPISSAVGTGVGLVAPALMGGAGVLTAPGAIGKAGGAVTKAAAEALPEATSALGSIATHAAAHAAGWATEGALYGAGNVIDEAALGDPNLTAQSALAEVGIGALLGGAIGGIAGAREGALPKALVAARDATQNIYGGAKEGIANAYRVAAGATGTAAATADVMIQNAVTIGALDSAAPGIAKEIAAANPGMAQFAVRNADKLIEAEKLYPGVQKMLMNGTDPEHAQFLLDNFGQMWRDTATRTKAARAMTDGMDQVLDGTNAMMRAAHTSIIPEETRALLTGPNGANIPAVAQRVGETVDSIANAAAKMRAEPELFNQGRARHLEQLVEGLRRDLPAVSDVADVFDRLNVLKRTLDEVIPYGQEALSQGFSDKNSIRLVKGLRAEVKNLITDAGVFGEAASRRAALNEAQEEWLKLTGPGGEFRKIFMQKIGGEYSLSPSKMDTHLSQIIKLKGEDGIRVWDEVTQAARNLADQVEQSSKSAPSSAFDKTAIESLINKSADQAQQTRLAASVTRGIREQNPAIPFGNGIAAPMMERAAGMLPGGTTIVSTIRAATSVSAAASVLAHLEQIGQRVSDKIDSAVSTLVRGGIKSTSVGRGEVAAGIAHVHGMDAAGRIALFNRYAAAVNNLVADPDKFSKRLEDHAGGLTDHAPQTAQALQVASARAAQFLASKIPHAPPGGGPLAPQWKPSQAQVASWLRYHEAVNHPLQVLKQAAAGTVTPEGIEVLRVVYPDLLTKMQGAITDKLTEPRLQRPSYQSRLGMSAIMGYSIDGSTVPAVVQRMQAAFAAPSSRPADGQQQVRPTQGGASKVTLANRSQTPAQASQARR